MSRRKFTASFKLNAIKLSEEKKNVAQVTRELGVKAPMIHRWKKSKKNTLTIVFLDMEKQSSLMKVVRSHV